MSPKKAHNFTGKGPSSAFKISGEVLQMFGEKESLACQARWERSGKYSRNRW